MGHSNYTITMRTKILLADANANAGVINIIYKKNKQEGFNGKVGFTTGLGSLWERHDNLPSIRPQYTFTPKPPSKC